MSTTLTSREANQDFSRAKRAAKSGPVIITDRGKPALVLLDHEEYRRLTGNPRSLVDRLAMPGVEHIEFELPNRSEVTLRDIDLS